MRIRAAALLPLAACLLLVGSNATAVTGNLQFVVLRVTFSDFGTGTRFTTAQTQSHFNSVAQLWGAVRTR
jgi:hypothetical protein